MYKIYIGSLDDPSYYFEDDQILTMHGEVAVNLIGEELSADTCEPEVVFEVRSPSAIIPQGREPASVKWNQLWNRSGWQAVSGTYQRDSNNHWWKNADDPFTQTAAIVGHKYYGKLTVKDTINYWQSSIYYGEGVGQCYVTGNGSASSVWTADRTSYAIYRAWDYDSQQTARSFSGTYKLVLIDLTLMFGAGFEPDLTTCNNLFYDDYYEYNQGESRRFGGGFLTVDKKVMSEHYTGNLRELPYGTKLWYYDGDNLVGQFYVKNIERIGRDSYRINATSLIGFLESEAFYGKLFNQKPFKEAVEYVMLEDGIRERTELDCIHLTGNIHSHCAGVRNRDPSDNPLCDLFVLPSGSIIKMHVKYNGISQELNESSYLGNHSFLFGNYYPGTFSTDVPQYNWGIYTYLQRASADIEFNNNITLNFVSNVDNQGVLTPLVTVSPGQDLDIEVNDWAGQVIINGTTYAVPVNTRSGFTVYGNLSAGLFSGTYKTSVNATMIDWDFYSFKRYSGGAVDRDIVPVVDVDGNVALEDLCWGQTDYRFSSLTNGGYASLTGSASAGSKIYNSEHSQFINISSEWRVERQNLLNRIIYGDGLRTVPVSGWIMKCSRREALYQLIFAHGAIITKTDTGTIIIDYPMTGAPISIPDSRIYNSGSVEYMEDVNYISVTEYTNALPASAESVKLFESTNDDDEIIISFDLPSTYSRLSTIKILAASSSGALVSGTGYYLGKQYIVSSNIVTRHIRDSISGSTYSVDNAVFINPFNSDAVLDRMTEYYLKTQKVKNDIVRSGERCGVYYNFKNPFSENAFGFMSKMSITASKILKASCEFIVGYDPSKASVFTHSVVLTGNGTWTVPDEVFQKTTPRIKLTLIGGGDGGSGGFAGENGNSGNGWTAIAPAAGGNGGESGSGGNIYTVTIDNPAASYAYSCGSGGAGGAISTSTSVNNMGTPGGNTTFGAYSSANGTSSDVGVTDLYSGISYAVPGRDGFSGHFGSFTCFMFDPNTMYTVTAYAGSRGPSYTATNIFISGGGPGGGYKKTDDMAPYGYSNGLAAKKVGSRYYSGDGGPGADCVYTPPVPTTYGSGGHGGNGGGGGGFSGYWWDGMSINVTPGTPGTGGYGGAGSSGADGCIIIYY